MYVLRTARRKVPVFQSEDIDSMIEHFNFRSDKYGEDKYEILDCDTGEVVDVESLASRDSDRSSADVSETVSEDSDRTLFGTLEDYAEPASDSTDQRD